MAEQDKPQETSGSDAKEAPETAGQDETATLEQALAEMQARADAFQEQMLRARAEAENQRKRLERETATALKYATERVFRDLLAVADSLELGLKAAREAQASASVIEGIELTARQLHDTLGKHGVAVVDPAGEAFNPELHEAMSMLPSDAVAPNHVLEVVQKGYRLHERVLRPARVVVAAPPAAGDAGAQPQE